jgi:hypothetical protein
MPRGKSRWPFAASADGLMQQLLLLQRQGLDFDLRREYVFHPTRKWRADFLLTGPQIKKPGIIIEYNGGIFLPKGGHQNVRGAMRDWAKGNEAQLMGYLYLQFGPIETKTGEAMNFVEKVVLESAKR